jgi:hypothetical protein
MSRPSHPSSFNRRNNILWREQIMKLFMMQFSPNSISSKSVN